jgi:hypothetical protein
VGGSNDSWAPHRKIPFGDFVDKGRGVKSSLEEELDGSMKTKDVKTFEH